MVTHSPQKTSTKMNGNQPLDQNALILTKAIGLQENGGKVNYNAVGDGGASAGQYQWNNGGKPLAPGGVPANFASDATKFGLNPADFSPTNQNQVAYAKVKSLLDSGMKPAQVASSWNAGLGEPNAYTGKFSNGNASSTPTFDVPSYVAGVQKYAQQLYSQQAPQPAPQTGGGLIPTADASTTTPPPVAPEAQHQDVLSSLTHFFNAIFPGKQVGDAIGTLAGYGIAKANGTADQYDLSAPSPLQVAGDVAQGALAIGTAMPEGTATSAFGKTLPSLLPEATTAFGRIATQGAIGAGFGLSGAVANGSSLGDVVKQTGTTALIGTALGVTGEVVSAILDKLPKRIVSGALNINPKVMANKPGIAEQALKDMSFGTKATMEKTSQNLLNSYQDQIQGILSSPEYDGVVLSGKPATQMVVDQFKDSNLSQAQVGKIVKQVAPEAAGLYDRFLSEGLNMVETNRLRSLLDTATNSYYTRNAVAPFSKEVTVGMANVLRNAIQGGAEETVPIFSKYTKELAIHGALQKIAQKPSFKVGLYDLLRASLAHGIGVPVIPALIGQEVVENPTVRLNAAKAIANAAPKLGALGNAAVAPILTGASRSGQQ